MQEQEKVISKSLDVKLIITKVFQVSIFIAIAVVAPYFGNQLITGSIVNALFFISATTLGLESAFLLCLVPSLVSIYTGLLPIALAPMIPFIMTGNALLVIIFYYLRKRYWWGAVSASAVKFIFIWGAGTLLAKSVLSGIAPKVVLMISWPQFATAIAGACIAYFILNIIKIKK